MTPRRGAARDPRPGQRQGHTMFTSEPSTLDRDLAELLDDLAARRRNFDRLAELWIDPAVLGPLAADLDRREHLVRAAGGQV